jgi:L-2-hydroxyglutarate oxidase LhgO
MLYSLCSKQNIPHHNTKKWLVAQNDTEHEALVKVHEFSKTINAPTYFLSLEEAKEREPDVNASAAILESPTTGIVDSHSLMSYLEASFQDSGGDCAFNSTVSRIEPLSNGADGYRIFVTSPDGSEGSIVTETLINSAGLSACAINNMILPLPRHRQPFYAKGTYFSYAASSPKPRTLVYPAPSPGHSGLGTHLTIDMTGRVRFGPDVEWIDDPTDLAPNPSRLEEAIGEIKKYLPSVKVDAIDLDYCGVRPKLGRTTAQHGKAFQDFVIQKEEGFEGFVNLLGIESPGLTSCLAIGEEVEGLLYGRG